MRTIETTVFKFDELSDSAKEAARDWYRQSDADDNFFAECVYDDAADVAELFGLDIRTRRTKSGTYTANIYYSGFSSQGDGACFEGHYKYKPGGLKAVKEYAPNDTELHAIVARLQAIQARHFYKLVASTEHRGHYYHSGCMSVDVVHADDQYRDIGTAEDDIRDEMRAFADWIYDRLENEYDYMQADEQVDESIRANEYEFTADGECA
jgi:hypothetical protein